jgi:hypothetical protein
VEFCLPMIQYPTNSFRPIAAGARLLRLRPEGGGAEFRDQPTSTLDAFRAQVFDCDVLAVGKSLLLQSFPKRRGERRVGIRRLATEEAV